MKKVVLAVLSIFLVIGFAAAVQADGGDGADHTDIHLSTHPSKVFFHIDNIKPGDYVIKDLEVMNKGDQAFNYNFTNKYLDGSQKLYNELQVAIKAGGTVLFIGNLKDFEKIDPRNLDVGESEKLNVRIDVPYELGNEFQGLSSEFQFKLQADNAAAGVPTFPAGKQLPNTATNMFAFIFFGIAVLLAGLGLYGYSLLKGRRDTKVHD
ncbi:LPXTG cell wall anchor domain-containing protein [Virgibacillus siamensis]|uniref:LPXTG cell wall anchor domain-containing protein n=1 Tax=Virgibacillus siamensis TaxID=480071 RepID=UPI00098571DB|nr:LPXTG cell wall anchor domain-containing protein [Virgibacillus siamensis]